jgi:Fe-coproporphyrin III synthase
VKGRGEHEATIGAGPVPTPVLQIHASRQCNLACGHCYSHSGPSVADGLDVGLVCQLIDDAAAMGYRAVAFSGGEPLIYPGLQQALRRAKALGLKTSVTTNGTLLDPPRLEALRDLIGLLAVSLDGPPALHNEIRGSSSAFDRLTTGIEILRSTGIKFGFIHTLTRTSWEHLVWLADFAHDNGASLLQIHPLELFGRAEQKMQTQAMTEDVLARAYLLSFALMAKYKGRMTVQLDVLHREQALRSPASVYAGDCWDGAERASDQLGVIVLEPDGSVVPLAYGFSRRFVICDINKDRFADAWPRYVRTDYPAFRRLCGAAFDKIASSAMPQLFNWHDFIVRESLT